MIVEPRTEQERVQPLSNAPSTGAAAGKFVWQRREHCAEIPVALDYLDHRPRPVRSNSGRPAATEHLQAPASWATQPDAAEKVKKRHKACGAGTLVLAAAAAGSKRPAAQAVPVPAHAMPLSAVLAQAAEEVERLEHERDKLKARVEGLERECNKLRLDLVVARQDVVAQTCNLRADVAHLTGQLQRAQDQVSTCEQQLQAAEADLAEQRVAAAAAADNAAGAGAATAARLAELEARCAEQQGELAALRARAEAQEAAFIATAAERKAEQQRHHAELQALQQECDKYKEAARKNKASARCISNEYSRLKATYKRRCEEMRGLQSTIDKLRAGSGFGGGGAAASAPAVVTGAGGDSAACRPPTSQSHHTDGVGSGSEQLYVSEQVVSAVQRFPSISSSEAELAQATSHGSGLPAQQRQQQEQQQQQLMQRPLSFQQRSQQQQQLLRQQQQSPTAGAAGVQSRPALSPVPPALADPPCVAAPPADEAWPAEESPAVAAPAPGAQRGEADQVPGQEMGAAEDEEDVELTQAVPPPAAPVVCSPGQPVRLQQHQGQQQRQQGARDVLDQALRPGAPLQVETPHQQQQQQQQQQHGLEVQQQQGSGAAGPGNQRKRPVPEPAAAAAADMAASAGQSMPLLPPKRHHPGGNSSRPCPGEVQEGGEQLQRRRQGRQLAPDNELASPVAGPALRAAALGEQQRLHQHQQQQQPPAAAAPWPAANLQGQQQQPPAQLAATAGWKSAVRGTAHAHAAFELGLDGRLPAAQQGQALQRGSGGQAAGQPSRGGGGGGRHRYIPPGEPGYKYQAVVRKKEERERLEGVECLQCKRFYEALESWGTIGNQTVRLACGHTQQVGRDQLRQETSRHRYIYRPPDTQEGFWDMDITQKPPPNKQDSQSEEQQQDPWEAGEEQWAAMAQEQQGEAQQQQGQAEQQWVWRAPHVSDEVDQPLRRHGAN